MKNQYFGDINDYRKYGLLRLLASDGDVKIAVCWMLTENDQGTDGSAIAYLSNPGRWRPYDPYLFDALQTCFVDQENRTVLWAEEHRLIPSGVYFTDLLYDGASQRRRFFKAFDEVAAGSDLTFFDPDNGIEVASVIYGRKNCCKYIYWDELSHAFRSGRSLLVYQHFKRTNRDFFREQIATEFCARLGVSEIVSFSTPHVLFLLLPQERHRAILLERCNKIKVNWDTQIEVHYHFCG
jgi:hypothetical protein